MNSFTLAITGIGVTALLGGFAALARFRRPLFAIPAILALSLALVALLLFGPQLAKGSEKVDVPNFGPARFAEYYQRNAVLLGEPVAPLTFEDGIPVQYFVYGRLGYIDSYPPEWRLGLGNVAQEYMMKYTDIRPDLSPVMPKVIAAYMADETANGLDPLRIHGSQLTGPILRDGAYQVWFQRSVFTYPAASFDSSTDPSSVRRLPIGSMLYTAKYAGPEGVSEWTTARKWLVGLSVLALGIVFLPLLSPALRNSWDDD